MQTITVLKKVNWDAITWIACVVFLAIWLVTQDRFDWQALAWIGAGITAVSVALISLHWLAWSHWRIFVWVAALTVGITYLPWWVWIVPVASIAFAAYAQYSQARKA